MYVCISTVYTLTSPFDIYEVDFGTVQEYRCGKYFVRYYIVVLYEYLPFYPVHSHRVYYIIFLFSARMRESKSEGAILTSLVRISPRFSELLHRGLSIVLLRVHISLRGVEF